MHSHYNANIKLKSFQNSFSLLFSFAQNWRKSANILSWKISSPVFGDRHRLDDMKFQDHRKPTLFCVTTSMFEVLLFCLAI